MTPLRAGSRESGVSWASRHARTAWSRVAAVWRPQAAPGAEALGCSGENRPEVSSPAGTCSAGGGAPRQTQGALVRHRALGSRPRPRAALPEFPFRPPGHLEPGRPPTMGPLPPALPCPRGRSPSGSGAKAKTGGGVWGLTDAGPPGTGHTRFRGGRRGSLSCAAPGPVPSGREPPGVLLRPGLCSLHPCTQSPHT